MGLKQKKVQLAHRELENLPVTKNEKHPAAGALVEGRHLCPGTCLFGCLLL